MIRFIVFNLVLIGVFITSADAQLLYITNADNSSVTITGYTNSVPSMLVIPTAINDLPVTAIGESALSDLYDLTLVTIPSSVTNIGDFSFSGSGLTSLVLPYGVTDIGLGAFGDCYSLTNVVIPESVTTIGGGAFSGGGLTSVTIPGSVIDLGGFSDCGDLTNLVISCGISVLHGDVFGACYSLPSVTIPGSVTNITDNAFEGCTLLTNVFFMGNAPMVDNTAFENEAPQPLGGGETNYYVATAYYLPGTTGWAQFSSNTIITPSENPPVITNIFVPTVLWNPTIQASRANFGVQNGQYGFDITATNNLPIAIEACDDLSQTNWIVLQRLTVTNGLYHFSEPFDTTHPSRFYRIGFP